MCKLCNLLIQGAILIMLSITTAAAKSNSDLSSSVRENPWNLGLRAVSGYDIPAGNFSRFFSGGSNFEGSLMVHATDQMEIRFSIGDIGLKSDDTPLPITLSAYRIVVDAIYHKDLKHSSNRTIYPFAIAGAGLIQYSYAMSGYSDSGTSLLLSSGGGLHVGILRHIALEISGELDMVFSDDYEYSISNDDVQYYHLQYCNILRISAGLVFFI